MFCGIDVAMAIDRKDIMQMLRDENALLKATNQQISKRLARQQQAFRVLNQLCIKTRGLSESYSNPGELSDVLSEFLEMVLHACDIENGSLILVDEEAGELEFVSVVGESRQNLRNHRMGLHTGIVGKVIASGESVLIEDVRRSRSWSRVIDERLNFHTLSLMCVPLLIHQKVVGAIEVVNHSTDTPFDENDLNILRVATKLVGLALEKVEEITVALEARA
jgi:GAF domain-containing protein